MLAGLMGHRGVSLCLLLLSLSASGPARADDKAICADSYESAQRHRASGKLLLSRAQLLACRATCPEPLLSDCNRWLAELSALIPKVRIDVRDASGQAVSGVRVLSGTRVLATTPAAPLELDPGRHELTLEPPGAAPIQRTLSLPPGNTTHTVSVQLEPKPRTSPAAQGASDRQPAPGRDAADGFPSGAVVLGGFGVVALGAGAALGVAGHVKRSELEDDCAPNCSEDDVDGVRTLWVIGGVSAAVGAAAVAGAILLWQGQSGARAQLGLTPRGATLHGSF